MPLKKWNKEIFGNIDQNIQRFEDEIAAVNVKLDAGDADCVDNARFTLKNQCNYWKSK